MDGMFFYLTNEGSCKYDSTKKMVLWNFWGVICTDFIILASVQYFEFTQNIVHSRKRRKVG